MDTKKEYTVYDVLAAECTLEPLKCVFCGSLEIEYLQYVGDAICGDCGKWQLEDNNSE